MNSVLRVGILAGESSGDILGAGLMDAILKRYPDAVFEGVGGPLMTELGLHSQVPMERLSVMGFIEPLKRLPELLRIRKNLKQHFINNPPDVFIGIDSPDFNLNLEAALKQANIPTVHYVSPSVWAWRQKRIHKIAKAVDLVLTLFPFELKVYQENKIAAEFVGHPLADIIDLQVDVKESKQLLGLNIDKPVLAILPGSRSSEVSRLSPDFLAAARLCKKQWPDIQVVLPAANERLKQQLKTLLKENFADLQCKIVDGRSRQVMASADVILLASGTATLEALLLKKPMLVCYRKDALSYAIISRLIKVPYFSLPNLLAGKKLVDELVQEEITDVNLFKRIQILMDDEQSRQKLALEYQQIHSALRQNASEKAADKVIELIQKRKAV